MPTIIDSLFLELGIDTSKFSKDQQAALAKIAQFESQMKRSTGNARGQVATVGQAFRDLAKDSRIGSSAAGIDNLATKFKNLGMSLQASGGAGMAIGGMARGLGMLLSPAALGAAAVGLVAKEVWDLNKELTASNSTLARNAELSGMSATNLWSMGQAAKIVGGNAEGIQASIANLQTSLAGMSIGAGSNVQALIGMARLGQYGAKFNAGGFGNGVDEESLFKAVNKMYKSQGRAKTMAMVTQYGLMNEDQANLAMAPGGWAEYQKTLAKVKAMKTGGGFENVVRESLNSQVGLGKNDIEGSIAAETAYGGIQQPMQTVVGLLVDIRAFISSILNFLLNPGKAIEGAKNAAKAAASKLSAANPVTTLGMQIGKKAVDLAGGIFGGPVRNRMGSAMETLMNHGASKDVAAAIVGSFQQESGMDPFAENKGHLGLGQWDKSRQADFAKWAGYPMGSKVVPRDKQATDQSLFVLYELQTSQRAAANAMLKAKSLMGKTKAFTDLYERPGDDSLGKRFENAQQALQIASGRSSSVQHNVTSETHIGDVHVHSSTDDPTSHVNAVRKGLSDATQPLADPAAQATLSLGTRAMLL
jgi:hypothetical protein